MSEPISRYLAKQADLAARPLIAGDLEGVCLVVVIPVLAEHEVLEETLGHLAANPEEDRDRTLVIVVVNNRAPDTVPPEAIAENLATLALLEGPVLESKSLRLGYVDAASPGNELGQKQGVGDARKLGLDWGLSVLQENAESDGLLINLDADTHVESNYLSAIREHFESPEAWGGVVDFAHRLEGPVEQQAAIVAYELFLRYHVLGLHAADSPYAFHTIGSTIACTANAYATAGGMKRRQAGEDFYFLQELAKTGRVDRIHATCVHPSPRPSWRVPFGTGPRVQRYLDRTHEEYRVYHPESYQILGAWLQLVEESPTCDAETLLQRAESIAPALRSFLEDQRFETIWPKLQDNAPDKEGFLRQFHRWFDAFATLKLIHHLRDHGYPEQETFEAIANLIPGFDEAPSSKTYPAAQQLLLRRMRNLERQSQLPRDTPQP